MNIVVLAGGTSTEREVSLSSATKVVNALKGAGNHAVLIDVFLGVEELPSPVTAIFQRKQDLGGYKIAQDEPDIEALKKKRGESAFGYVGKGVIEVCRAADIVYMGLHGENGENGRLQALFDILDIKYTGSGYLGSALAMDKGIAKQVFIQNQIPVASGVVLTRSGDLSLANQVGFPCVVKPCAGGSSIGVFIVEKKEDLADAISKSFAYEPEVLVESYIKGREFSVGILGDKVLPVIEIIPKTGFYDYVNKYQKGFAEEVCPANLDAAIAKQMQQYAYQAFQSLKLEVYARIDFLLDAQNHIYCLEANTLPGMTPTSLLPQEAQVIGVDYEELCQTIVQLSLNKYK